MGVVCAHAVDMNLWLAFVAPDLIAAVVCLAAGELAAENIVVSLAGSSVSCSCGGGHR